MMNQLLFYHLMLNHIENYENLQKNSVLIFWKKLIYFGN